GVASIAPAAAPFQVQVTETGGTTRTLSSVQAAATTGSTLYELLQSGDLWQFAAGAWTRIDRGVKSFVLDSQGKLYELEQTGQLWLLSGNRWSLLDSGVLSIALAANDTLVELEANGSLWTFKTVW